MAVVAVVAFHLESSLVGGYVGVDVFFVISGYLISGVIQRELDLQTFSYRNFYLRRVRRIMPALIAVLLVCSLAAFAILLPSDLERYSRSTYAALFSVANFWFWSEGGYFGASSEMLPLLHTWSLAVEEQFYLVLPWVLVLGHRRWRASLGGLSSIAVAISLLASGLWVGTRQNEVFYFTPFRAWELLLGSVLALHHFRPPEGTVVPSIVGSVGLGLVVGPCFLYSPETSFPGFAAALPCVGTAVLIWSGQSPHGLATRLLRLRAVVFVGRISYSLYLWHWPCIVFARHLFGPELNVFTRLCLGVIAFALATLSWRFIETPFRNPTQVPERRIPTLLLPPTVAILLLAVGSTLTRGFEKRFSEEVVLLDQLRVTRPLRRECIRLRGVIDANTACHLGAATPPRLLIWGDSFAHALLPAFDDSLRELGKSAWFVAEAGCPPIPSARVAFKGQDNWRCREFNSKIVEFLESDPGIRVVLLAAAWDSYLAPDQAYVLAYDDGVSGADALGLGLDQLLTTVSQLRPPPQVVVLGQVPTYRESVPLAMAQHRIRGASLPNLTADDWNARSSASRSLFQTVAADGGIEFVDPVPWFCNAATCTYATGSTEPLYRDGGHLSSHGVRFVRPHVRETIRGMRALALGDGLEHQ